MADPNLGQTITAAWEAIVKSQPEDNIFEDYWLLFKLRQGQGLKTIDGGRDIQVPLEYATNTSVAFMSELEAMSTTRVDLFDTAQFAWKQLGGTVVQSVLEDAITQGSGGKFDLLAAKLANLKTSNEKTINESCFSDGTGTGGKEFGGLKYLVATTPTSGSPGGINRATFTFWRNQYDTATQTSAAFDNLRAKMRNVYNDCSNGVNGNHPTFGVTTQTVFEGFEGLLLANERYTSKESGDGGFKNEVLKFKGMELAYDADCPSGSMYLLNPKFIKLCVQKGYWLKMLGPVDPANQTATITRIVTIGNLIVTNPRMLGAITSIT